MSGISEKAIEAAARAVFESWHDPDQTGRRWKRRGRPFTWENAPPNTRDAFRADARFAIAAFLAQAREEGYAMMPSVATPEMVASEDARCWLIDPEEFRDQCAHRVWRAMFDAAPKETGAE